MAWGLAPGASDTATVALTVPNTAAVGTYNLRVCTDMAGMQGPIGNVHEANEQNNCFVAPGQVVVRNPQAGDVF